MITLQQLDAFCAVADYLSFTRAAEALNMTQPGVTFHIRSLERQLNLQLFETKGRRVHLTAAGEYLWRQAAEVLNSVNMIERHMRQFSDVESGSLKLGATLTIGNYLMPSILTKFHRGYSGIQLSLQIMNTARIEQALLARELDLAMVEWHINSRDIEVVPLQSDELVIAVPKEHPFAQLKEVQLEQLVGQAFVMREEGSGTRALALESLGPVAEDIDIVLELSTTEAIKRAITAGLGITIISLTTVLADVKRGDIAVLRLADRRMQRNFSLAHLRSHVPSPAVHAFMQQLRESFPDVRF